MSLSLPSTIRSAAVIWTLLSTGAVLADETVTYTYDALGRLVKVVSSGTVNNGTQTTYEHDAADNRTHVVVAGSPNPPPQ